MPRADFSFLCSQVPSHPVFPNSQGLVSASGICPYGTFGNENRRKGVSQGFAGREEVKSPCQPLMSVDAPRFGTQTKSPFNSHLFSFFTNLNSSQSHEYNSPTDQSL